MPALATNIDRHFSPEEYFTLVEKSEERYEYHNGELRMMAGGTFEHSLIKSDVNRVLGNATVGASCNVLDNDMAIKIEAYNCYVLPDVSFLCDAPQFDDDEKRRRLLNPSLLIEVMSESSEAYDRGEKFQKYRSLPSFREYMLIDSRRYAVECWYKEDEKIWRMDSAFSREESVYLHTLDLELSLEEVYRRVTFG